MHDRFLSQSWAVISGGARFDRARMAMEAVDYYLVKREEGLILLFTPPFDTGELEPGILRVMCPGYGKTAPSIPMRRLG